jgi:protein TonB
VRIEGEHPADVLFFFEDQRGRLPRTFIASLVTHVAVGGLLILAYRFAPEPSAAPAFLPDRTNTDIVWLSEPGPGGGGGGGGNQMKEPPRKAELPGKDKLTVPVSKPPDFEQPKPKEEPQQLAQLNIPAQTLADATQELPGALETPAGPPTPSQGTGRGGGAGTGTGSGIGSGTGSGLGEGFGGGTGGGAYRPGNGVTQPRLIREIKPQYTSNAMRAKVQGSVLLECVVRPDGSVTDVQVLRSLDPTFGLDQEAIKAAMQWRFQPGTRFGQPVPVLITIELTFTLR